MTSVFSGSFLVKGGRSTDQDECPQLLVTDVPLSFWGGIDPETGQIVDTTHPLFGENITDKIFCLPSGRGSCTASQVLLELILGAKAPKAIVLRDVDGLVCVGALVAQEVFYCENNVPDIVCLGSEGFGKLLEQRGDFRRHGMIAENGDFVASSDSSAVEEALRGYHSTPDTPLTDMYLTNEEANMLELATNEAERMAMRVLIRYAKLTATSPEATKYLDVAKAHIDGCTYIGPGGLEFAQKLVEAGGKVKIPTTLNSVSADRNRWQALGVPKERALASIAVGDAYLALGCQHSFTCAPYLLPDPPQLGQDIVWGESNAVVYANTVLGARTEKYADYLDICCAIVGKVPASGVHLLQNRQPRIVLDATELLQQLWADCAISREDLELLFPVLGHLCGSLSDGCVPIVLDFDEEWSNFITADHLKSFCAAFGTTGTSPLVHIAGITPEAKDPSVVAELVAGCTRPTRIITLSDVQNTFEILDSSQCDGAETVDLVAIGNPHLSLSECEFLDKLVDGTANTSKARIMACMSRTLYSQAEELGYVSRLERFGVEFVNDTCWCMLLDSPIIPPDPNAVIMTNSGKYAHYGPGLTDRRFRFGSMAECVEAASTGRYPQRYSSQTESSTNYPSWLSGKRIQTNQVRTYPSMQRLSQIRHGAFSVLRKIR